MLNRKLILEGFNYTNDSVVRINALEFDNYLKTEGLNQETVFEALYIEDNKKMFIINLDRWESESWSKLIKYCAECELSHIKILKEFKDRGYSGMRSLYHVENNFFAKVTFSKDLTNIEEEDALFEYLVKIGVYGYIKEEHRIYMDTEKILRDWQINEMPVLEIENNVFAILLRDNSAFAKYNITFSV